MFEFGRYSGYNPCANQLSSTLRRFGSLSATFDICSTLPFLTATARNGEESDSLKVRCRLSEPPPTVSAAAMMVKYVRLALVLLTGFQLAGCYTDYGPVELDARPVSLSGSGVASHLQPGDKVKITVYGEEALTGEYDVNPNGYVSMPLIESIRAAGRTQVEFGKAVADKYRSGGFLQDPKVTVAVVQFRPFYVLGEAANPGEYPFRSGLNVHAAVAMAGGFTYRASRSFVLIRHTGEQIWKEYPLTEPVSIAPGDLIRVPERYF
jgi:Polysaccharide biosynthesis/export protein/SLBB domain